jgi:hypothetical protein
VRARRRSRGAHHGSVWSREELGRSPGAGRCSGSPYRQVPGSVTGDAGRWSAWGRSRCRA